MIFLYVVAVIWAIGMLGAAGFFVFGGFAETVFGQIIMACIAFPLWVVLGLWPLAEIRKQSGPVEATLLKSEWQCAAAAQYQTPVVTMVGKVPVTTMQTVTYCTQYNRR